MTLSQALFRVAAGIFFKYQIRWMQDWYKTGYLGILGGRQIGKDFLFEFLMAVELVTRHNTDWVVISATKDHAKIFLRGVKAWYDRFRRLAATIGAPCPKLVVNSAFEIVTEWGTAVAASAGTVRALTGKRGGVILNEVPLIPEAENLYSSALAQVAQARTLGKPARLAIIGNASFIGTYWHGLWTGLTLRPGTWTLRTTRWSDAMRDRGMSPEWIAAERARIIDNLNGNVAAFEQWFECNFRAAEGALYHPDLLTQQSYDDSDYNPFSTQAVQFIGYDVGRVTDPSAWCQMFVTGQSGHVLPIRYEQGMPFPQQRALSLELARQHRTGNLTLDGTGLGGGQTDDLRAVLAGTTVVNEYKIGANKWELFGQLKGALEAGKVWLPASDLDLRIQLESVQSELSDQDMLKVVLPRIGAKHADGAVALALAVEGARHRLAVKPPASPGQVVSLPGLSTKDLR